MKNFIANLPLYGGLIFKLLSDFFFNLSFKLHITFKTEAGLKLVELDKAARRVVKAIQEAKIVGVRPSDSNGDRKLVNMLNGGSNVGTILTTGKKSDS